MSAGSADERFMDRALTPAENGRGRASPNPLVGCVLVVDGTVVGEGWHHRAGLPHAEVEALRAAGERARGATANVTLEPCNHHGRTPPFTEALLDAGVARVVIASPDPNPITEGAGVRRLREGGVTVSVGVREVEAAAQNEVFFTLQRERRPFVLYKTAMTLDGNLATRTGQSRWSTGEAARTRVHRWRNELDAVAVGIDTVLLDDPRLTARVEQGRTPLKVVFDSVARTPPEARLFEPDETGPPARVLLFCTHKAAPARLEALRARMENAMQLRDIGIGAHILADLGVHKLRLLTNKPRKVAALKGYGLEIVERVPLHAGQNPYDERYLNTKIAKLGHLAD
ncbi:MAG: bifunctional diaminohydroxyphosphoribosylaminopyrimidine deaminase/5-amino-6-(5-phosphoribosylamino)uracil reductase RibD [Deinococcales bacterium]